jgi:homoserine kinase type II
MTTLKETIFKQRIGYSGDLTEVAKIICRDFRLGKFLNCKIIFIGYEDFNFSLNTTNGNFLVKIYEKSKTLDECKRNTRILVKMLGSGISTPKLHKSKQGYSHLFKIGSATLRLSVMDLIDGQDFFTSTDKITRKGRLFIARQAALINSVKLKPQKVYDSWAIPGFLAEFKKKSQFLEAGDLETIESFKKEFLKLKIKTLPHCFVHGDIISTNVIKDKDKNLWLIDFSVSNYYPRIQELAVLACDILFDKDDAKKSKKNIKEALAEYQKTIKLTPKELASLPLFIKLAHAMHVLNATYEKKVNHNKSKENEYFLKLGLSGLRQKIGEI